MKRMQAGPGQMLPLSHVNEFTKRKPEVPTQHPNKRTGNPHLKQNEKVVSH
jgi:hypothetical protein